ncbi:MAG: LEA type 2 family protein [Bacteroidota bacterium]|nr:LEA type 2 family protein [Bacteroidota bacterium]
MKKNLKKITGFVLLTALILSGGGCGVVQQAEQAINLKNCDFRIMSVQDVNVAGVNIQNYKNLKDLRIQDVAKITKAIAQPSFPLSLQLNLQGRNPNTSSAGLNKIDYILYIDDIQMTAGSMSRSFVIPPNNGTAIIPMQFTFDLKQVLKGKSLDAIINFGFNLAGAGNKPTRILIKIRPTIMMGSRALQYPGYINVKTEFAG